MNYQWEKKGVEEKSRDTGNIAKQSGSEINSMSSYLSLIISNISDLTEQLKNNDITIKKEM